MKSFHLDVYSRKKVLYNSLNSNITSPSSQYTPTKRICPCVPHVLVVYMYLHFVQLIVSSLLFLSMPLIVSVCHIGDQHTISCNLGFCDIPSRHT